MGVFCILISLSLFPPFKLAVWYDDYRDRETEDIVKVLVVGNMLFFFLSFEALGVLFPSSFSGRRSVIVCLFGLHTPTWQRGRLGQCVRMRVCLR